MDEVDTDALDRAVRWLVYQHFKETGAPPPLDRLSRLAERPAAQVRASLRRLADAHALALEEGTDRIWMAHPFSAVATGYRAVTRERSYHANCAWDALAIPALLGLDARIHAAHPVTRDALQLEIRGGELQPTLSVIHFLVPRRRFWDDIGFT